MSINEIAKRLITLRETRMTGFIMAGVLREELGFEGYGEALRRRWIEADMEQSGMMTITNHLGTVAEIRQLASECKEKCGTCGKASCKCDGRCDSCDGDKCTCESQEVGEDKQVWKNGQYWDKKVIDGAKEWDKKTNTNPESGLHHAPDCDCGKCPKSKKNQPTSETAHFFAQAHAFRRNAVSEVVGQDQGQGIGQGSTWEENEPAIRQYMMTDPKMIAAAKTAGMDQEQFYRTRMPQLKAHWDKAQSPGYTPPAAAAPQEEVLPDYSDEEHDEFYQLRQPDLLRHFHASPKLTGMAQPDRDKAWGEFEPSLKTYFRGNPNMRRAHHAWRSSGKGGTVSEPQRGNIQGRQPDIGFNDSKIVVNNLMAVMEAVTFGLGNTGDAPDLPVPGVGQGSSQGQTQRSPAQAQSPANPSRPQAVTIGNDVAVVENGKQYVGKVSRMLPDGKYEISFAGEQPPVRRAYDKTEVSTAAASAGAR